MQNQYIVELTDLFCGELNYSYVTRYAIAANTIQGAIGKLAKYTGLNFRKYYGDDEDAIYHTTSKLSGCTIDYIDNEDLKEYTNNHTINYI